MNLHTRTGCALILLLAGAGAAAEAPRDWGAVWLPAEQILLRVPPAWHLDYAAQSEEALLVSPEGETVAVLAWDRPREVMPAAALQEMRERLGLAPRGEPADSETVVTAQGLEGLLVTDLGEHGRDGKPVGALAVFTAGTLRVGLVLHGPAAEVAARRAQWFDQLMRGLWLATATEPRPPEVEAPVVELPGAAAPVEAPAPTVPAPPAEAPVAPAVLPPAPLTSVGGFMAPLPPGWSCGVRAGTLWVEEPERSAGYFLWPAQTGERRATAGEVARYWAEAQGLQLEDILERTGPEGVVLAGTLRGQRVSRALLYVWQRALAALVMGMYAPAETWTEQAPVLAHYLESVTSAGWQGQDYEARLTERWVDDSGELALRLPAGWSAEGGVQQIGSRWGVDLTVEGPDLRLVWRQPITPGFRELTPILEALGYREGDRYRDREAEDYLRVMARGTLRELVEHLLRQAPETLQDAEVLAVGTSATAGELLAGEDSRGAVVRVSGRREGRVRERLGVVASAALPVLEGAFRWQAAQCSVEYSPGGAAEAVAQGRALLAAAAPSRPQSEAGVALAALLERTRRAWSAAERTVGDLEAGPRSLLGEGFRPAALGQAEWSVAEGLESWRRACAAEGGLPDPAARP